MVEETEKEEIKKSITEVNKILKDIREKTKETYKYFIMGVIAEIEGYSKANNENIEHLINAWDKYMDIDELHLITDEIRDIAIQGADYYNK